MLKLADIVVNILKSNVTQTLILLITPFTYIVVRYYNRREAARTVIMQIDDIDKKTKVLVEDALKAAKNNDMDIFWQSDKIIEVNSWEINKRLLTCGLDLKQISYMDKYYSDVLFVSEQQEKIKYVISEASKSIAYKGKDEMTKADMIKIPIRFLDTLEMKYKVILSDRAMIPYEKLKKIAKIK